MDRQNATLHCLTAIIAIFALIGLDCILQVSDAAQARPAFFNSLSALILLSMTGIFGWIRSGLSADRSW